VDFLFYLYFTLGQKPKKNTFFGTDSDCTCRQKSCPITRIQKSHKIEEIPIIAKLEGCDTGFSLASLAAEKVQARK
jgi:hypothetical protein